MASGGASLSPTSLNFGVISQTDPPRKESTTLTNNGTTTITITEIEQDGTGDWQITKTCGSTLAALASCTISLTFDPSTYPPGVYTGTLYVYDTANNSPQTAALKVTVRCGSYGC